MNFFYEVLKPDCPAKYYSVYNVSGWADNTGVRKLMWGSHRVWAEHDDGTVYFVKNKLTDLNTPIDKKEFFLIKLKSESI